MLGDQIDSLLAAENQFPRQQEIRDASERVDVGAGIDRLAECHLGRHIGWSANCHLPWYGCQSILSASIGDFLDQPEVHHFDEIILPADAAQMNVCRLDVPMYKAVAVCFIQ